MRAFARAEIDRYTLANCSGMNMWGGFNGKVFVWKVHFSEVDFKWISIIGDFL
jgi:hypothetical protein